MSSMRWLVVAAAAALLVTALRAEDAPPVPTPGKDAPPAAMPPGTDAPPAPAPAKAAPRQPMKHKPDVVAGDAPRVDLEVDPRCGVAIVAATVNGTAGRFVLGTGTSDTMVTTDFAAKVGIDRTARAARAATSDGGSKEAKIARVQSLKVGTTDFKDFDVGILALDELMNHLNRPADGVLGANVVLALPVTLDYVGKRLVFGRPTDLSGRKELAAEVSGHRLVVQGTVDGEKTEFVVDTTASYSALVKSAWRGKIQQAQTVDFAVPQEVTLGGVAFQNMAFALSARNVLGLAFFQRGEVVFDAENKKVYVTAEALTQTGPVGALTLRGQAPPPPGPPPQPAKPLPPALEKQVADLQARLMAVQDEAFRVVIGIVQAQQKALEALGMTAEKAAEELQRRNTKPLRDYKATLASLVPPLQALDGRFVAILRQIHAAEVDRRNADARPRLAALIDRGLMQRKNVQDKIADLWEKAGDYKAALAVYEAECQVLVERQRTADLRAVKEKMAEAYDKAHESAMALSIYKGLYDAVPPNERGRNVDLMFHLAHMYEKMGDLRNALDIYREAVKNLPPGAKVPGLAEKIASLESRVGSAPDPSSGSSPRGR